MYQHQSACSFRCAGDRSGCMACKACMCWRSVKRVPYRPLAVCRMLMLALTNKRLEPELGCRDGHWGSNWGMSKLGASR